MTIADGSPEVGVMRPPLAALRDLGSADVFKAGRLAATLTRRPGEVLFEYTQDYLDDPGRPVASTLPVDPRPVRTSAGEVPAFFAGLLPEGWRLSSLRHAVKTSADDQFSLLLAVGADTVGDVQVVPTGALPIPPRPLITVERSFEEVTFAEVLRETGGVDRTGLAGVQDKVSAGMISVPAGRAGRRYILKIDPGDYPGVVQDEAFFLAAAADAGLSTVSTDVVHDATGRPGLLVGRFDRYPHPDGHLESLAVEDGSQVLGLYPADKYSVSSEVVVTALAARCPARPVALLAFFTQLCFAWLTGNGDVHAKNLSILRTADGEWRPAPAYDLPSTLPYLQLDQGSALSIGGKRSGLSRRTLLAFAEAIGLPDRAARRALDGLLDATADLEQRIGAAALPFSPRQLSAMTRTIRNRRRTASGS